MSNPSLPNLNNTAIPVLGQPFTILGYVIATNVALRCNCPDNDPHAHLEVVGSRGVECPNCGMVWNAFVDPSNGQLKVMAQKPEPAQPVVES
jgi:hypothetical protein